MTRLVITDEYEADVDRLYLTDANAADAVEILLQLLYEDLDLLGSLHNPDTYPFETPAFEVKNFIYAQQHGYLIFTLKFKDLNGFKVVSYRLFLGFNAQQDFYYALALTDRAFAYDPNHHAYGDLCNRYDKYRIPKIS